MDIIKDLHLIKNFDNFIKLSLNKNYIQKSQNFVKKNNIQFTAKELISLYAIAKFPNIVADSNNVDNSIIIKKCNYFFNNYEKLILENKIKLYLDEIYIIYKKWKKNDLDSKLNEFINAYYEFDQMYINLLPYVQKNDILINNIKKEQFKLVKYIKNIGGKYGFQKLSNAKPVYLNIEKFKNVATKSFWDSFIVSIDKELPNYTRLIIMLKEIKSLIKNIIPNKEDMHIQIEENIDTELLLQMLSNNAMNFTEIYNLMNYIYTLLKSLDCPANDEKNNIFWKTIEDMIEKKKSYGNILKEFLIHIFNQLEEIQKAINSNCNRRGTGLASS